MTDVIRDALARALIDLNACREITRHTMGEPHGLNQTIGMVESALAALPPAGWRDISTAPKDGTEVIYFSPTIGRWVGNEPPGTVRGKWNYFSGAWRGHSNTKNDETHWMPLPPAPGVE